MHLLSLILLVVASAFGLAHPPAQSPFVLTNRVPILLGVMSRCPDALLCESVFDGALKQTWGIVDVALSFIGTLDDSDEEFGVTCMHGVQECRGNVQELCAIDRAASQEDWWHFVQCLNFEGKEQVGDAALAERCAGVASIPWDDEISEGETTRRGMKSCVESEEGSDLLKASVKQSQDLGIEKSCTIMISGKTRCIRDGAWKECELGHSVEEIVSYIKDEYQKLNSQATSDSL
ncbi:hypothetical protein K439DRAFT_1610579 [Ramaria rubella]|nr:hypothetical protein K439DRAFT_1610579 [Ramaria rubella]